METCLVALYYWCTDGMFLPHRTIDLFTNVSQMYGCFFPQDLVTSHFINLYLTTVFQYLVMHFAHISLLLRRTNLGHAFRLSRTTFVKVVCIRLVNRSIACLHKKHASSIAVTPALQ